MATIAGLTNAITRLEFDSQNEKVRAMETAFSGYLPSFSRQAFRYLRNAADAEDAVQEAMLSAYRHVGQFKGQARMSTWLAAIVINSARMQLRRRPRQKHIALDEQQHGEEIYSLLESLPDHRPNPEETCRWSELAGHVAQLARHLSPTLRRAFQLRDLEGRSIREMADLLGVAEGTVKARIARARTKLRKLMWKRLDQNRRHSSGSR